MVSPVPTRSKLNSRLLPLAAVFVDDLRQTARHWAFLVWMVLGLLFTILWSVAPGQSGVTGSSGSVTADHPTSVIPAAQWVSVGRTRGWGNQAPAAQAPTNNTLGAPTETPPVSQSFNTSPASPHSATATATELAQAPTAAGVATESKRALQSSPSAAVFAGRVMRYHLLLWASFVIALGASAIASEADIAPEAILCRGISRWQYYLGKCSARTLMVVGLYLLLSALAVGLGALRLHNDMSWAGLVQTLKLGALTLAALAALSVAGSVWFRSPLIAFAVVWMCLYGVGIVTAILEIPSLSPITLADRFPLLLQASESALPPHHLLPVLGIAAILATAVSLVSFCTKDV